MQKSLGDSQVLEVSKKENVQAPNASAPVDTASSKVTIRHYLSSGQWESLPGAISQLNDISESIMVLDYMPLYDFEVKLKVRA